MSLSIMQCILIAAITLTLSSPVFADNFYSSTGEGWLNYDYSVAQSPDQIKTNSNQAISPSQKMKAFHAYFENVKDAAIENPTDEAAVEKYIALQNYIQNQSIRFTETWQKVLLDDPKFDYELIHPTNSLASKIDHNGTNADEKAVVSELAKTYGMMFFYSGQDQYAQTMATSLQQFADDNGIALIGVSMDGKTLDAIKDNQVNQGQAQRMGVQYYPAIFLVNPHAQTYEPLAYGFISQDQLLGRFYQIATNFSGQNLLTGEHN